MPGNVRTAIAEWGGRLVAKKWGSIGFILAVGSPFIMFISLRDGIGALIIGVCMIAASRSIIAKQQARAEKDAAIKESWGTGRTAGAHRNAAS